MAQVETEKLTQILWGAALSRAVCTIAGLGIADQIEAGSPQSVESIAGATGTHERSPQTGSSNRVIKRICVGGDFPAS
jgi:hypothetical protein